MQIDSKWANDIRSNVYTDSRGIWPILCGDLLPWVRHGSTTTCQKPNSRSSGRKPVVHHQSKGDPICRKGRSQCVLVCQRDSVNWLPWKKAEQLQANITVVFLTSWMSKFARRGLAWRRKRSPFTRATHLLIKVCWQWESCRIWGGICSAIPPYSPDLAPSDFHLFPNLKKFVSGKCFVSNEEVERVVDEYFNSLPDSHFWEII